MFRGLAAKRGTLIIYINMYPLDGQSFARLVTSQRIRLNRLASADGYMKIDFEAYRGMSFAILGHINDDTDASAEALEIWLQPPATGDDDVAEFEEGHSSIYQPQNVRQASFLMDLKLPSFSDPVSQVCTNAQIDEPSFQSWAKRLSPSLTSSRARWEEAYILQVAKRYGALESDARALGLGVVDSAVPKIMREHGLSVVVTTPVDDGRIPVSIEGAAETVPAGAIDIPRQLVNFDLLWSRGVLPLMSSYRQMDDWVATSLRCLRPGGLAIHVGEISRTANGAIQQTEMERLMLTTISRGHDVARLKFARSEVVPVDDQAGGTITSFGMIIRKALAPF